MSVLRGPSDADHYRVKVGRYGERWYTDPLPACDIADASDWQGPSISTVKKASGSDWSFVAMQRVAKATDLGDVAALDQGARYDRLKSINSRGLEQAAGRGTIVHLWCEDLLNAQPMRTIDALTAASLKLSSAAVAEAERYRTAVAAFFDTYQPRLVAAEVVCIHRTLNGVGYGGTGDAIVEIDGANYYVDWKSRGADSDHGAYPEEAAQIAGNARAEYMIVDGPQRQRLPELAGGLVVSIRPDGCRVYPVDLDAAFTHWTSLHAWWVARRDERKPIGRPWAPKATPVVEPHDRDKLRARIGDLIAAGHEDRLRMAWPHGVAPLSQEGHAESELGLVLAAVRKVEADVSATFHPDDAAPPSTPVIEPPVVIVPLAAPDEGGPVDTDARDALAREFAALPAPLVQTLAGITREANAAGRHISVSVDPTVRRWSIARALVRWAQTSGDIDDLWGAAGALATADQAGAYDSLGELLGLFNIAQANHLHDAFDRPVAA